LIVWVVDIIVKNDKVIVVNKQDLYNLLKILSRGLYLLADYFWARMRSDGRRGGVDEGKGICKI